MTTTSKIILAIISAVIIAALAGFLWYLGNLEMPEAGIAPVGDISHARLVDLTAIGVVFPSEEMVKVQLTPEQIKKLYDRFRTESPPTSLLNKWGHPYAVIIQRKKDKVASGGYYYHWMIYDVGKDGKLDETNDLFMMFGSRP